MVVPASTPAEPLGWASLSTEAVLRLVWRGRRGLLMVVGLFAGLGVAVALLTQPEFLSEARIMPETGAGSADVVKRLASVAGFSGVDMASEGVDAIRPDLYPSVLHSTPFMLYLMNQTVTTSGGQPMTVGHLLKPDTGGGWWGTRLFAADETPRPARPPKAGRPMQLSAREQDLAEDMGRRISARLDTRSGVISISARMPDAAVAAAVAQLAMDYLTQYVTNYRTEKARQDLRFYDQRLREARRRYQTAQLTVFRYNDQHKYFVVQAATMEKQRTEAELAIAQTVYTELARQFEQAKLKVQERTPVFNVLEPAQVPLKRVSPKRMILVLLFALAGLVVGVAYLLAQPMNVSRRLRAIMVSTNESMDIK